VLEDRRKRVLVLHASVARRLEKLLEFCCRTCPP
jgi:hypothetical protein